MNKKNQQAAILFPQKLAKAKYRNVKLVIEKNYLGHPNA